MAESLLPTSRSKMEGELNHRGRKSDQKNDQIYASFNGGIRDVLEEFGIIGPSPEFDSIKKERNNSIFN